MKPDTLELCLRSHSNGLKFYDFAVSGQSLYEQIRYSRPTCLWPTSESATAEAIRALLLEEPTELGEGQVPLFICEECGDLYCGGQSVRISRDGKTIKWSHFMDFMLDIDENHEAKLEFAKNSQLGDTEFIFEEQHYKNTLREILSKGPKRAWLKRIVGDLFS